MTESILLVEDDKSISDMVAGHLTKEGYRVVVAFDGEEAGRLLAGGTFDLVILDLMLPALNGIELLKRIRQESWVPVLIISAKDSVVDKALGLGLGADDYLAKPFSLIELTARVKAALRRAKLYMDGNPGGKAHTLEVFDLVINLHNFSVTKGGREIKLTAKEFHILRLLAAHPNRVFTRAQLYEQVWNDPYYGDENVINVHISRLRDKIEDNPSAPKYIKTLWGIGYKLGRE